MNPIEHIWYCIIIFVVIYLLLESFLFLNIRRLEKKPEMSYTNVHDLRIREIADMSDASDILSKTGKPA